MRQIGWFRTQKKTHAPERERLVRYLSGGSRKGSSVHRRPADDAYRRWRLVIAVVTLAAILVGIWGAWRNMAGLP